MQINRIEESTVAAAALKQRGVRLSLQGVGKSYGDKLVLSGIDLDLAPGEFVAVIGRSGCGKSTLLRTIAQLEAPDRGTMQIGAADSEPEVRIMFQEARLLPWKSVLDNVALGLKKDRSAAAASLATVGLASRGAEWPTVLSGGQRQRVALARALVHDPQLLLLDEPLGALDALTRIEMQQLIESLWRERGFTAVLVTHDVQEALVLADRVLLIEDAKLALDLRVDLPRHGRRGTQAFAALEQQLIERILGKAALA
ncbi:ATP-binding cassette domain-containing protein [Massilia sp. CF038]|uniref:ATP-binding cassette domain-containing protein n=1 Tax=Massilia sp. CF038 TaxID=1881045 RepID=UPI0009162E2E|nr:ATP-binding cassette domain-containing protein [Massilia sp. CF038]SHH62411.1 sulfonate transport system ATP-binding protein [Massilia sp. CF038]